MMKKVFSAALLTILVFAHMNIDVHSAVAFTSISQTTHVYNAQGEMIASVEKGERYVHEGDEPLIFVMRGEIAWDHFPGIPEKKVRVSLRKLVAIKPEYQVTFAAAIGNVRSRRIMLNYPPVSSVWHLPSGVSQLTALLRNDGHEVVQRYGHIMGLEYLLRQHDGPKTDYALGVIRDPGSDILSLYKARMAFEEVSRSVPTQDKFIVERSNAYYVSEHYDGSIQGMYRAITNREHDMWYRYFADVEVPAALDFRPDVYGISTSDERQFVQTLLLASMIKEVLPNTIVVIGGNFWSRVTHAFDYPEFQKLFDHCDVIVYREGFQPLQILARTLDPLSVPGAAWRNGNKVIVNPPVKVPTSFEELPTPVFDGGITQWSPDPVYPLYTSSNCTQQCDFCAISAGSDTFLSKPRMMSPARIAHHMCQLGTHRFDILDEHFPIGRQLALGTELRQLGYMATWQAYLNVSDRLLDPQVCHDLYAAGCRCVLIGLETLTTDTLLRESKPWNHPENYGQILRNLREAGIQTHVFLLLGLPGEPLHRNLKWLAFLEEYGDSILTLKAGRYRLIKMSPKEQGDRGNELVKVAPDDKPLHLNRDFRYTVSSRKRVEAMRDIIEQMCRNHWAYGVTSTIPWWINRGRYTWDDFHAMAKVLPPEQEVPHLARSVRKVNGIVHDELGLRTSLASYSELVAFSKNI